MKKSIVKMLNVIESIEDSLIQKDSYRFDDDGNLYMETGDKHTITFYGLDDCDRNADKILKGIESFVIIPIPFMYNNALKFSQNVKIQNRDNWRLPNTDELYSIFCMLFKEKTSISSKTDRDLFFLTSEIDNSRKTFKTIGYCESRRECLGTLHSTANLLLIKNISE